MGDRRAKPAMETAERAVVAGAGGEAGAKRRGIENGQDSGSAPCDLVMVGACHSAPVQACGTHNTEGEA